MSKKKYKLSEGIKSVRVEEHFLPEEATNMKLGSQIPKYIVIHEVSLGLGKTPESYDMQHYADKILTDGLNGSAIGYHYLVGDKKIYHFIPDTCWVKHTGTDLNFCSIGIERLVCKGISYCDALHNQAKLAATLMIKWNIPFERVISHKTARIMCGKEVKDCPSRLNHNQYGGFELFKNEIKKCLQYNDLFDEVFEENVSIDVDRAKTLK